MDGREQSLSNGQSSPQLAESSIKFEVKPFEQEDDEDVTEAVSDSYSETTADEVTGVSPTSEQEANNTTRAEADQDFVDGPRPRPQLITQQSVEDLKGSLAEFSEIVKRAVAQVKTPIIMQDVKMFSHLSKYFTGEYHFEEIMYRENVRRSQLLLLLDKFRDVLITCEKEDADINFFKQDEW